MQAEIVANSSTMNTFHTLYTEAMEIREVFAQNMLALREGMGWSAKELGAKIGVTAKHVYDLEKGRRSPSVELLQATASAFGVPMDNLLATQAPPVVVKVAPSTSLRQYLNVPDDVVQLAQAFGPDHAVWRGVKAVLKDRLKDIEKEKGGSKQA